jgi:hypothetical protein
MPYPSTKQSEKDSFVTANTLRVVSGAIQVTCPKCQRRHQSSQISLAPSSSGGSYCERCVTEVATPAERAVIDALNRLDSDVWDAALLSNKSSGSSRSDLARLVEAATSHIIERRLK